MKYPAVSYVDKNESCAVTAVDIPISIRSAKYPVCEVLRYQNQVVKRFSVENVPTFLQNKAHIELLALHKSTLFLRLYITTKGSE